jgi:hypothetical protein
MAQDAIDYWDYFRTPEGDWLKPPIEAMEEVEKNPVLAAALAVKVEKKRLPNLEPLILSNPDAMILYYIGMCELGEFKNGEWPEMEERVVPLAQQKFITPLINYVSKTHKDLPGAAEAVRAVSQMRYEHYLTLINKKKK